MTLFVTMRKICSCGLSMKLFKAVFQAQKQSLWTRFQLLLATHMSVSRFSTPIIVEYVNLINLQIQITKLYGMRLFLPLMPSLLKV